MRLLSLPVWEEWIEIMPTCTVICLVGLFPYGKSGLKFQREDVSEGGSMSLPVWEEWIEI